MAGIQGTNIVAPVVPLDTADVHPTHEAQYGKGGFRSVETTAARDAIPAPRREAGMLVYVAGTGTTWRLGSDLATWTEDGGGGGGGGATGPTGPASTVTGPTGATGPAGTTTWSGITGTPATFPPSAHTHAIADTTGLQAALDAKAPLVSPFFNTANGPSQFYDNTEFATEIQGGQINTQSIGFQASGYQNRQTHAYTPAERTKLAGIATGATANATDAQLRDRSTHTGTQAAGTITGLAASATTDTTNAANITSGTLDAARLPASGVSGDSITTGTVAAARLATHTHAAGDITSGTLDRARIPGDLGTGSMTVSGSNSYGVSLDATARTLTQANTLAVMGGQVGIGTLEPTSTGPGTRLLEIVTDIGVSTGQLGQREVFRIQNSATGTSFDISLGESTYNAGRATCFVSGQKCFEVIEQGVERPMLFASGFQLPQTKQIVNNNNANAYIQLSNGAAGLMQISGITAIAFERAYVEVGRWDTNSVWNVGTGHVSAANSGGSSVTGNQARVRFPGQVSTAAGRFAVPGDAQASRYHLRRSTTDATAATLFRDGSSARITIPPQSCWSFKIRLSAYNSTDGIGAAWVIEGGIRRDSANNTALLGTPAVAQFADTAMASTSVSVTADNTNALQVNVTGLAGKTIRWHAVVETSEVSAGTPS